MNKDIQFAAGQSLGGPQIRGTGRSEGRPEFPLKQGVIDFSQQEYQPRYLAYCTSHGKTPEAMLAHDYQAWPGGVMCGFILWISEKWQEFFKLHPACRRNFLSSADHDNFDSWLTGGAA